MTRRAAPGVVVRAHPRQPIALATRSYPAHVGTDDEDREVLLTDDFAILPDQTSDDTDAGWGERADRNDERLLAERPPHWD